MIIMMYFSMQGSRKFHQGGPDVFVFVFYSSTYLTGAVQTPLEKHLDPLGSKCIWMGVRISISKETYFAALTLVGLRIC